MLKRNFAIIRFCLLLSLIVVVLPQSSKSWSAEITENLQLATNPSFSTH